MGETRVHNHSEIGNFFDGWGEDVVHFEGQDTDVPPHYRCEADVSMKQDGFTFLKLKG